ncbi:DNA mismatch repair endonuclease MutL [Marivirga sp. S37H4]|uniref:DNA mismatch repair protein MutL n=1 Tax=Marivirga aurantiaca TaxID=2802615 RepID=A0A935CAJ6_9BACT|nr:DNA mismatch repair endonuclease MutL [Marivirga aurantiaca]MBK6266635.1 DNA mismatch repair endonuclease MutL [Marivirga aurantiaca]
MPNIIQLLPDAIANQIAAGEVVQRPASVVKELMENAIDAGAKNIKLVVKDAGKQLIQVVDDGSGMNETDARMCFERHATSKIRKSEDLFTLKTMGFRGEAMASIAAVSQVELKTKTEAAELGTLIQIEASEVKNQTHVASTNGSSISVKNLFYNVPARRNFLKSNPVELRHIIEEFQRIALSYPAIAFSFHQNDLDVYQLTPGKLSHRIVGLFGKNYQEQLVPCDESTDQLKIYGYIGKPEFAKKTRGEQFFFVNNRFIRSGYLHHAVINAYEGLLARESHPFYVLFIEIDPQKIDVNVHPTKTEIKFDDERTIYGIMSASVKQAIGTHNVAPALDFESDVNFSFTKPRQAELGSFSTKSSNYQKFKSGDENDEWNKILNNFQELSQKITEKEQTEEAGFQRGTPAQESVTFGSSINDPDDQQIPAKSFSNELTDAKRSVFQIHHKYIATQVKSGLMLVDQQAAHERILFEKFSQHLHQQNGSSQQFLFPEQIKLSPADYALVIGMEEELKALGFVISSFGKETIVINGAPTELNDSSVKAIFEGLIDQFKHNKNVLTVSKSENISRSLAKRSAIRSGQKLNAEEMNSLIDKLFACENPNYTPSGNSTFIIFDLDKIASFFNR